MMEIVKVLSTDAKIFIIDEPTSALSEKENERLFVIINEFKKQGCGIVYISHCLDELARIAGSGEVFLFDKELVINMSNKAIKARIVFVPEDRRHEGLCTEFSVLENIGLVNLDKVCNRWGLVSKKAEIELTDQAIQKLKIKTQGHSQEVLRSKKSFRMQTTKSHGGQMAHQKRAYGYF